MRKLKRIRRTDIPMGTQTIIAAGFALIIILVAVLLMLPISSADHTFTDPLTAFFTATSAVCVTGLVRVDTAAHWSAFGESVLIIGIQIGGLGVMTILALFSLLRGSHVGLRQRTLLSESIASLHFGGIVRVVRRALIGTAMVEGVGALLLSFRFVPQFGLLRGLWFSFFHSISAFCNAGFDLMGNITGAFSSFEGYVGDPLVNCTLMAVILIGGLGFFVWDDLVQHRFRWKHLSLHTRVVLLLTVLLTVVPTLLFFITERSGCMADMDTGTRLLASAFSAVTPRTAGFDTVPTDELSAAGSLLTLLLMLCGGNPGSTAGGAKTTTMLMLVLLGHAALSRREDVQLSGRRLPGELLRKACAIVVIYLSMALTATFLICALQPELALRDVLLEVFSAVNTVGMTTGVTRMLCPTSCVIIMLLMYAGRLGSMTFAILVVHKAQPASIRLPEDRLLIG